MPYTKDFEQESVYEGGRGAEGVEGHFKIVKVLVPVARLLNFINWKLPGRKLWVIIKT